MSKITTLHWAAYTRNQEAVAAAIVRREYTHMTPTGAGVIDEFFALMDQVGILNRLAVEGVYQRRMIPMALMMTTYCAKIIQGLSSQNQMSTHLFRDAGLLRRIGYTAKQIDEGFCQRGTRSSHPQKYCGGRSGASDGEIITRHLRWVGGGLGQSQIGG